MIQTEFKDLVFEFAKRISGISEVRSLILFGSVAEGKLTLEAMWTFS